MQKIDFLPRNVCCTQYFLIHSNLHLQKFFFGNLIMKTIKCASQLTAMKLCLQAFTKKALCNEVILRGQNLSLKLCKPLKLSISIERVFRSFHTGNKGSLGQTILLVV